MINYYLIHLVSLLVMYSYWREQNARPTGMGVGGGSDLRLVASPGPWTHHAGMISTGPTLLPSLLRWLGVTDPYSGPPGAGAIDSQVA